MKKLLSFLLILVIAVSFCSCGSASDGMLDGNPTYEAEKNPGSTDTAEVPTDRKQIKTVGVIMESLAYDDTVKALGDACNALNGYVESASERGNSYNSSNSRSCTQTFRIPADSLDSFLEAIGKAGNIISSSTKSTDVTQSYLDSQSRLASLELQKERYMAFLEKAETTADMIAISDALSDVIYEIEKLTAQLQSYDSLVAYSTVTVDLREVKEYSPEPDEGFFTRVGNTFVDSFEALMNVFEFIGLAIVAMIPFLILPVAIIVIIVLCVRRSNKKRAQKKENNDQSK